MYDVSPEGDFTLKRVFHERCMVPFADWLEYYNKLDVVPFLESLEKMRDFYTTLAIDIFKDAVSLPGVSLKYLLRGTLDKSDAPELYAPRKKGI